MEFLDLHDAVAEFVRDGDEVALEGFTHLIPFAAGHEIIRQRRKNLTLIRMTPDLLYDQMIGMGTARKLVFSCSRSLNSMPSMTSDLYCSPARMRKAMLRTADSDQKTGRVVTFAQAQAVEIKRGVSGPQRRSRIGISIRLIGEVPVHRPITRAGQQYLQHLAVRLAGAAQLAHHVEVEPAAGRQLHRNNLPLAADSGHLCRARQQRSRH